MASAKSGRVVQPIWFVVRQRGLFIATEYEIVSPHGKIRQAKGRASIRVAQTLDEVRTKLPGGLTRHERTPTDDPSLIESWA